MVKNQPLIFMNHRSDDETFAVAVLYAELTAHYGDRSVFLSRKSLPPGTEFSQALLSAVKRSSMMLAVIGPRWITVAGNDGQRLLDRKTDWVRREITTAFRARVPVVPILLNGTSRLNPNMLPRSIRRLARLQEIRVRHDELRHDLDSLRQRLELIDPWLSRERQIQSPA
jgi:hypothetical protein